VPKAVKLAVLAESHGWVARQTYALADVPTEYYLNGRLAKAGHQLASLMVRLRRGADRGWAAWYREDEGPWRFDHAFVGMHRVTFTELTERIIK